MGRFRSAITGLFTTKADAEANPATTVRETRPKTQPRGRRVHAEELAGLNAAVSKLGMSAVTKLFMLTDPAADRPNHLCVGDAVQTNVTFGPAAPGLRLTMRITVEEGEDAKHTDG